MWVYTSKRSVSSHTDINTFHTHVQHCVSRNAYSTAIFNMQERQKEKRQAFFHTKRGGTDRRRGVLPSFASAASLFYGPAEIYSPLLFLSFAVFHWQRMGVLTHSVWSYGLQKKKKHKLKTPNMKALRVVSASLLRHLRLKRLPKASEGSKGLDEALRWR